MVEQRRRLGTALLIAIGLVPLLAMQAGVAQDHPPTPHSLVDDWTHRHVVFSGVQSAADEYALQYEPRYQQQRLRHNHKLPTDVRGPDSLERFMTPRAAEQFPFPGMTSASMAAARAAARERNKPGHEVAESGLQQDWGSTLTAGGQVGDGMYPAKFTFDVTAAPDCTSDYVAFNTSLTTGAVAATRTGTFTAGTPGGSVTIGGTLTLTASTTDNTGTNFQATANTTTNATNLAAAIARNGASAGVTATSAAAVVTVTALAPGTPGNSIALVDNLTAFTWAGAALAGGVNPTRPSIVAYNNLYSTQVATLQGYCGGSGPSVLWAYAAGTGSVLSSPALALDGSKIIFVETKASGAVLHALQWKTGGEGTVVAPAVPAKVTSWGACPGGASCIVDLPFTVNVQATNSAPFYDYVNDAAYVGDDAGNLHKFSPVLSGTPAEVTTGGWPVTVDTGLVLNSPVLDPASGNVFVTSSNKACYVTPAPAKSCTAALANGGIVDSVIVDSSAGKVLVFSSLNGATVQQYTTSLTSPVTAQVASAGNNANPVYTGAFDSAYLTSALGTGKMYVCGKSPSRATRAALYRITFTNGVMSGAPDAGALTLVAGGAACSPVTEFYSATTGMDWIFLSVGNRSLAPCPTTNIGCVQSLNVTGTAWPPLAMTAGYTVPSNALNLPGTSGIVVDNASGTTTVPKTSLSAALTNVATSFTVASAAGFGLNDYIQVDAEIMWITNIAGSTVTVTRAQLGTAAAAHLTGTAVVDLRTTILNGAITNVATSITVDSNTTFNVGDYIQIDTEAMLISLKPTSTTLTVTRAQLGSTAAAHADNVRVTDLSRYPQAASAYFSFTANSLAAALCNGATGVGCAVKLTQDGLR